MIYNFKKFNESKLEDYYIFLDINGVLIPYNKKSDEDHHKFFDIDNKWSKEAIDVINKICDKYDTKVILISSFKRKRKFSEIKSKLKSQGFTGKLVDKLKDYFGYKNRFRNIEKYINDNNIINYIVLDDKKHDISDMKNINWIKTKSKEGLKSTHLVQIENKLKNPL
jgi:hypothetical protein